MPATPPESHADLLERPLFAHLATVRPDGSPQSNVMWFEYVDGVVRFTHTSGRQKYKNLQHEKRVAFSIADPDDQYRFLEVRGEVSSIDQDTPEADFYKHLQKRYGVSYPIPDAAERVIITITPSAFAKK
jgi:PPOX class probable F420-dependent enzyme